MLKVWLQNTNHMKEQLKDKLITELSLLSGEYPSFCRGFCNDMPWALRVLLVE